MAVSITPKGNRLFSGKLSPYEEQLFYKRIKPTEKPKRYKCGHNVWVNVTPTGSKTFIFRKMVNGKTMTRSFGQYPTVSLDEAFEKALRLNRQIHLEKNRQKPRFIKI